QRTDISVDPANSAAHVSLSSHLQLSNNRPDQTSRNSPSQTLKPGTNQHRSQFKKSRAKVTVASSAAALVL
ncbi:hypothetical protein, partial [Rhizobium sp. Rhizsp42]|uniref:hypothetical protein n=1 Tax=Rhizobium sp. Rhizsp42 TaxID=3243034 RepID=UPI0039B05548